MGVTIFWYHSWVYTGMLSYVRDAVTLDFFFRFISGFHIGPDSLSHILTNI